MRKINPKFVELYKTKTYHEFGQEPPYLDMPRYEPLCKLKAEEEFSGTSQGMAAWYYMILCQSLEGSLASVENPAFTLSSGLDSSALLFLADRIKNRRFDAFSVIYEGSEYDESAAIKEMLGDTVNRWHPVLIRQPDVRAIVKEMIELWGEPIPTITWMSHYLLCREVSRLGFKSLFHGIGGDELNAGEYEFYPYYFADLYENGELDKLFYEIDKWRENHSTEKHPKTVKLAQDMINKVFEDHPGGPFESHLKNKLYLALNYETVPVCVRAIEKNCKLFGLTPHNPYLEKNLISFMFRVPNDMKINNGEMKMLHRETMMGVLPEATRLRTLKTGWNAPIDLWMPETKGMSDLEKQLYWQKMNLEIWFTTLGVSADAYTS